MMGSKAGDNAQITTLAEALGWPSEAKYLAFRKSQLITNLLAGQNLLGLIKEQSSPLTPPWPDLMITSGRRNEPVCRWIRAQGAGSRLVHLGRPWAPLTCFDLVVTTPQYHLPEAANVLMNTTPLHRVTAARLDEAARVWGPRVAHLPRPLVAVMMGGNSGPYILDAEAGALLGRAASAYAKRRGGSLVVSSSARTSASAVAALEASLDVPAEIFRWRADVKENPYYGYLALAEAIIVTCESMSMLAEACATGKPVFMFDLNLGPSGHWPLLTDLVGEVRLLPLNKRVRRLTGQALIHGITSVTGPRRLTRDVRVIQDALVAQKRAVWLGERFPETPPPEPLDEVGRAVGAVKALFAETESRSSADRVRAAAS
ncbi:MAG: ELM1/GtrOC1 family putative glycosyltransferase [Pseudomonadota bacterium]